MRCTKCKTREVLAPVSLEYVRTIVGYKNGWPVFVDANPEATVKRHRFKRCAICRAFGGIVGAR
jgi:hypothetical protein